MSQDAKRSARCPHPTFLRGMLRSSYAIEPSGWTGTPSFAQSLERVWLTAARKIVAPHGASIARSLRRTPNSAPHRDGREAVHAVNHFSRPRVGANVGRPSE